MSQMLLSNLQLFGESLQLILLLICIELDVLESRLQLNKNTNKA